MKNKIIAIGIVAVLLSICCVATFEAGYGHRMLTRVEPGWNLISVRGKFDIHKENINVVCNGSVYNWSEAVDEGFIVGFIYEYNVSGNYYDVVDVFNPHLGYWFYSYVDAAFIRDGRRYE